MSARRLAVYVVFVVLGSAASYLTRELLRAL